MPTPPLALSPESLADVFRYYADYECRDYSPLYARLCDGIAEDPALLELAATVTHWPVPNVFLAAVQFLLLEDPRHPLAAFYPSVSSAPAPGGDVFPVFRAFCLEHADMIRRLAAIRRTQTNEVARCACLLPAFGVVAAREPDAPLALIEVGASAGLNLNWDAYGYDYGAGLTCGPADAPVRIACERRGTGTLPLPDALPRVAYRMGLDLHPIDIADPDELMWLHALIWPEHVDRVAALRGALEVARHKPPPLLKGNALDVLPDVLDAVPPRATLCVFHSFTLNQFSSDERADFRDILAEQSYFKLVYRVSFESDSTPATAALKLYTYWQGEQTSRTLATCHPHGRWIDWAE